jgi:hypothetical protein
MHALTWTQTAGCNTIYGMDESLFPPFFCALLCCIDRSPVMGRSPVEEAKTNYLEKKCYL